MFAYGILVFCVERLAEMMFPDAPPWVFVLGAIASLLALLSHHYGVPHRFWRWKKVTARVEFPPITATVKVHKRARKIEKKPTCLLTLRRLLGKLLP